MIRRIRYDVLRVLATLSIIIFHFDSEAAIRIHVPAGVGWSRDMFGSGLNLGSTAVCVFFLLSGALSAKDVDNDRFRASRYYRRRFLRLYVPFWLSYFIVFVWQTFVMKQTMFAVPGRNFIWTILGLDGYLLSDLPFKPAHSFFYLVGEWFFGALILITILWPLVRWLLRKCFWPVFACIMVLAIGIPIILSFAGINADFYRLPTTCLMSFAIGVMLRRLRDHVPARASWIAVTIGFLIFVLMFILPPSPSKLDGMLRYVLLGTGIFVMADFPQDVHVLGTRVVHFKIVGPMVRQLFIVCSQISMYAFLIQHKVIVVVLGTVSHATFAPQFGGFDYFALMVSVAILIFLLAFGVNGIERSLRRALKPMNNVK